MIRLHHSEATRSMRTLWLLYELGVDFDLETYPFDKSLRSDAYLALNPAGRVPTLEIDGIVLTESGAMTQVLCERFDPRGLGRPGGHAERPMWLNWIHHAESISQHCAALNQQHIFIREDWMRSPTVMKLEAMRLAKTLSVVENGLTGDYLLKGGFSAADISVGQAVYLGHVFVDITRFPKLSEWYARITAREAFQAAVPDVHPFHTKAFYPPWEVKSDD